MLPLRDRLPTRSFPIVNYALIAINVVAFVWERALLSAGYAPQDLLFGWGLIPRRLVFAPLDNGWTIFTSMFMHDPSSFVHLGGNMLFLWIFGDNVEDALGSLRYAAFYVLAGVVAAGAQVVIDPGSTVPMVGASGAISGVLAAYGSLYPRSPVLVFAFIFLVELPAWVVILEYFVVNLLSALGVIGATGGGVAFFAHLGGFVGGLLLIRFFMIGRSPREHEPWKQWRPPPRRPRPPPDPWGNGGTRGRMSDPRRRGPWAS
jgi:membrane associated rhomboid family serine protease